MQELQIGGTSVVLDLTFASRTRGDTEANVKSTTLEATGTNQMQICHAISGFCMALRQRSSPTSHVPAAVPGHLH
jgi:hypothetical protein